jgi:Holliday junction resolvase RusA-like endonuclease
MPRGGVGFYRFKEAVSQCSNWGQFLKIAYTYIMPVIYETNEYKKFKKTLAGAIAGPVIDGKVDVRLSVSLGPMMDSDAPIKPIFDAIEDAGILPNDRKIRNFIVSRSTHKQGDPDAVVVKIYRAKEKGEQLELKVGQ